MTATGNLYAGLPAGDFPDEAFETLAQAGGCTVERIVSRGHATPPGQWYDQVQGEWVVLLRGRAGLRFADGEALDMAPGDYVWIAPRRRHRVEWTSHDQPAVWLAVHIRPA
ncbi:MAG: cupin domain-containing protein [Pseudomonadota bacterium]|nr:cupin domain-containing protein [Pseudomonadota bacterium]